MGCAQLYDAAPHYVEVIDAGLVPRTSTRQIAGPAYPVNTKNDMLPCLTALASAPEGSVLIFNDQALKGEAIAGDIVVASAKQQSLAGLIVHGAVRDIDFLEMMAFPVYSKSVHFAAAKATSQKNAKVPDDVILGTVKVRPDDWVFGDSDGLLVVKKEHVSAVYFGALMLRGREERLKQSIAAGSTLAELSGMNTFLRGESELRYTGGLRDS